MASCLPARAYQPVCPLFKPPLYESLMDSPSPLQFPLNVRPSRPYCRPTSPSAQLLPPPDMTDNISDTPAIPSSRGPPSVGASSRARDATHPGTEFTDTLAHQVGGVELSEAQSIFLIVLLYLRAFSDRRRTVEGTFSGLSQGSGTLGDSQVAAPPAIGSSLAIPASGALPYSALDALPAAPESALADRQVGEDEHPPSYALSVNETTWGFLTDMLELRISLATVSTL